jgi:hypothetical protein
MQPCNRIYGSAPGVWPMMLQAAKRGASHPRRVRGEGMCLCGVLRKWLSWVWGAGGGGCVCDGV